MNNLKGRLRWPAHFAFLITLTALCFWQCTKSEENRLKVSKSSRIVLIGNNLGSRMMNFGHFETEMHARYPDSLLVIRNMCDGGDTPGFRPHSGRQSPWAFPGAEKFQDELGVGHKGITPDGLFSLEEVECIGACCWAPAIQVNYAFHDELTPESVPGILAQYRDQAAANGGTKNA